MTEKQTPAISGTSNIAAIYSSYTITLTGLEENTTYRYYVTAINCIGVTTTAWMTFKTLSEGMLEVTINLQPLTCMYTHIFMHACTHGRRFLLITAVDWCASWFGCTRLESTLYCLLFVYHYVCKILTKKKKI